MLSGPQACRNGSIAASSAQKDFAEVRTAGAQKSGSGRVAYEGVLAIDPAGLRARQRQFDSRPSCDPRASRAVRLLVSRRIGFSGKGNAANDWPGASCPMRPGSCNAKCIRCQCLRSSQRGRRSTLNYATSGEVRQRPWEWIRQASSCLRYRRLARSGQLRRALNSPRARVPRQS